MDDEIIEHTAAETRRHFDVVAERLEHKMEAIAEIHDHRIDRLEERFDHLEGKLAKEFNDVRSMIKFSHHELDRRVRTL